ncbi:hypothetical protein Moror_16127 [Moniliophthora roreri MCA 2997]|uniref:Uncharacterized protein n=1 Tax=Moniliophthora roreri (strain MCA 2997) TaxID=1381753 RepID=V2WRH5_MONRO|nr:hypothetical protein Moror_16127 [Moniliophthora roreri MCA 2997]
MALLLFFVGVLELLWARHPVPFAICMVAVTLSAGLYFATTFLPAISMPQEFALGSWFREFKYDISHQFICPYKSPQSWAVYSIFCKTIHLLLKIDFVRKFARKRHFRLRVLRPGSTWSSVDVETVRGFDQDIYRFSESEPLNTNVYELRALQWTVATFRDSPSMIPHLHNVLGSLHPSVVLSAVLGYWEHAMWEDVSTIDVAPIKGRYKTMQGLDRYISLAPRPKFSSSFSPDAIKYLFSHQYWMALARRADAESHMDRLFSSIEKSNLQQAAGQSLAFVVPFPLADTMDPSKSCSS